MAQAEVRLHLPARMLAQDYVLPPFYTKLMAQMRRAGAAIRLCARDWQALAAPSGAHFDFVHNGTVARPQALNLGSAYLPDFFYCDPKGLYFESSIADLVFDPAGLDPMVSTAFLQRLRDDYVTPRRSRYAQPDLYSDFGAGHIAVLLQDWSAPLARARYMDAHAMIRAVLGSTGGRRVIIKPHPRNMGEETIAILADLRAQARDDVLITDANLHDILCGAALSVSISSSASLEGMLHGVPAVLFGRSDLAPCAAIVQRAEDWPAMRDQALTRDWPFAAFLHWFLRRHAIDEKSAFLPKILARMGVQGADFGALGLKSAYR